MEPIWSWEEDWGVGWIAPRPALMRRASYALRDDAGAVWLIDPVDVAGLDARLADLGPVRGVIQLLDRHPRDCAALAARHGAPHERMPAALPGTPFEVLPVRGRRRWHEIALWWPQRRALVVADCLGTAAYFRAGDRPAGVHPLLRLTPPRTLAGREVAVLLPGHGAPLGGPGTAEAVASALGRSRSEIPRWLAGLPRALARG